VFGAGLGSPRWTEFELFGEESDDRIRARKLDEGLAILNGLWSGSPFSFDGDYYRLGETQFLPKPVQQPRPPVWVAGSWPNKPPLRRAARWDGVFPEAKGGGTPAPDDVGRILRYVREQRASASPFDVVLGGWTDSVPAEGARAARLTSSSGLHGGSRRSSRAGCSTWRRLASGFGAGRRGIDRVQLQP
jgi:alkanesulfonate monooxygenase SsuD/methylene tetrahydromethanopterin reductase-like flavin-dependent oxidoreductase (luciferase family)